MSIESGNQGYLGDTPYTLIAGNAVLEAQKAAFDAAADINCQPPEERGRDAQVMAAILQREVHAKATAANVALALGSAQAGPSQLL